MSSAALSSAPPAGAAEPIAPGSAEFRDLLAGIAAGAAERESRRLQPFAEVGRLKAARFGALRLPKAAGGGGLSLRELFAAVIDLAEADPNVAHVFRNHFAFLERYAQNPERPGAARWRREAASGAVFGLAGPESNAHPVGRSPLETRLLPEGEGWRVSGLKIYSTGSLFADFILVRAQDSQDRYVSLVIPADREGVTLIDDWDGVGQRLTGSGSTRLEAVRILPGEAFWDEGPEGTPPPYVATLGHLYLAAVQAGILRGIREEGKALLKRRIRSFAHAPAEKPAEDPLLQQVLGEISALAFAGEAAVLAAADALGRSAEEAAAGRFDPDLAHEAALRSAQAKIFLDEASIRAGGQLFDLGGASAAHREANLDRHWRNARTLASHNPRPYKAQAVGAWIAAQAPLPDKGFF